MRSAEHLELPQMLLDERARSDRRTFLASASAMAIIEVTRRMGISNPDQKKVIESSDQLPFESIANGASILPSSFYFEGTDVHLKRLPDKRIAIDIGTNGPSFECTKFHPYKFQRVDQTIGDIVREINDQSDGIVLKSHPLLARIQKTQLSEIIRLLKEGKNGALKVYCEVILEEDASIFDQCKYTLASGKQDPIVPFQRISKELA
jgi:hypothetical protein